MRLMIDLAVVLGLLALPLSASAAVIGGVYYAVQYDYREFFAATDGRNFQVILAGSPFPTVDPRIVARDVLPVIQAAKPRPALTFTYDAPVERPKPDYRLVLVFDPANDLWGDPVCRGTTRFKPGRPGIFYVYAVLLPQRPDDVRDNGLDTGERPHRSAHRRAVPGPVQRFARAQAPDRRRNGQEMTMTLTDRHVVVTGGTGALGAAVVRALLEAGAVCHVPAIESAMPPGRFPDGAKVTAVPNIDLADEASVAGFYSQLPPLHAVVNIAGGFAYAPIADSSLKILQQQLSMNLVSCVLSCRQAVANFRKAGKGGHIVNIAARPALNPRQGANMTAYTASKAAVAAFTVALAEELKGENISVVALCPSTIDTPGNRTDMPKADHSTWVKPEAIAELIVAQCSLSGPINSGTLMTVYGRA
jgi:NAD(P)-dependent dehydrogenase (short-subunit alcohol dehydrogenase family)